MILVLFVFLLTIWIPISTTQAKLNILNWKCICYFAHSLYPFPFFYQQLFFLVWLNLQKKVVRLISCNSFDSFCLRIIIFCDFLHSFFFSLLYCMIETFQNLHREYPGQGQWRHRISKENIRGSDGN